MHSKGSGLGSVWLGCARFWSLELRFLLLQGRLTQLVGSFRNFRTEG